MRTDLGDDIQKTLNTQVEKKMAEAKKNLQLHVDQELLAIDTRTSEVTNLQDRLAYCEGSLTFIGQYESMKVWRKKLMEVREKEGKDLMHIIEQVLAAEEKDRTHDLELNRLERERRNYNFRISKMPENQKEEDCVNMVADFIWSKRITKRHRSIEDLRKGIEYAYRIGKRSTDFSRQIVVKMFSKPDRRYSDKC